MAHVTTVPAWVETTYLGLADLLESDADAWDAPSLCEGWQVRHVVAHMTMPVRFTPERYGAELAEVGGDFGALSDRVALRDGALPVGELVGQLRSPVLHGWTPPGGGEAGARDHAVIHSLDVTVALDASPVAPPEAVTAVLDQLAGRLGEGAWFGVDPTGLRLEADDGDWQWSDPHGGDGPTVRADRGTLVALLGGRTLPDGRSLPRR